MLRFTVNSLRRPVPKFVRMASTQPRGLQAILAKRPDDVVITFAKRSALGRRGKGQLAPYAVDELMHAMFKARPVARHALVRAYH